MGSLSQLSFPSKCTRISVPASAAAGKIVAALDVPEEEHAKYLEEVLAHCDTLHPRPWTHRVDDTMSATTMFIPRPVFDRMVAVQAALDRAVVGMAERWFDEGEGLGFWRRMRLDSREEELLRWMITGPEKELLGPFKSRQGVYRPDFLVELLDQPDGSTIENLRICEINGRLPFNQAYLASDTYQAWEQWDLGKAGLVSGMDVQKKLKAIAACFDPSLPVHVVRGEWHGESVDFGQHLGRMGQKVVFVHPNELRVREDKTTPSGNSLWHVVRDNHGADKEGKDDKSGHEDKSSGNKDGSPSEEEEAQGLLRPIHQLVLNLFQSELFPLPLPLLKEVALRARINDLRTVLLTHDQRFLGVISTSLDDLLNHGIITPSDADLLRTGIAQSVPPSSTKWRDVIENCRLDEGAKNGWVLKAGRGGFGNGHTFGPEVSNAEWLEQLEAVLRAEEASNGQGDQERGAVADSTEKDGSTFEASAYCLQRVMVQAFYDSQRRGIKEVEHLNINGAYIVINGEFMGFGMTRAALQRCLPLHPHGCTMSFFTEKVANQA